MSAAPAPGSYKMAELATWNSSPGEITSKASFSPDGTLIAFASTKSGTKNIWVTQSTSTDAIQKTNDAFENTEPVWSPKGDEIAYFSNRSASPDASNVTGIWRAPALGGTPRLVGAVNSKGVEIRRWTASGKIYYVLNKNELYAMDLATGNSQKVPAPLQENVFWIDISPDEKALALAAKTDGKTRIFTSEIGTDKTTDIAAGLTGVDERSIVWLPEKKRLFYGAITDGVMQIFLLDIDRGRTDRLTATETDSSVVDAAPDGRSVILSSAREESNLWRVNLSDAQESPVSRDLNTKIWPAISPDDQKAVFQSIRTFRGGSSVFDGDVVLRSLASRDDGERPTVLAQSGFFPAWAPDGSSIAFMRKNGDKVELCSINPAGGGERLLTSGGISQIGYSISPYNYVQSRAFAFSPDSSRIAYVSDRNGASNIWTVGLRDGSDIPITKNTDTNVGFYAPIWSADGSKLAFFFQTKAKEPTRGLNLYDGANGEIATVFQTTKSMRIIGWTPDETGLIIVQSDASSGLPPSAVIKRIAVSGGKETVLADLKNVYFYNIFLSDDRKQIAYVARSDNKDDIWVMPSAGGPARKLTGNNDSGLYFSRLAWLHDGSSIVFGKQTRYSLLSIINDIR
jgi:TolB protein